MSDPANFFDQLKALYSKEPMEYDEKVLNPYLMLLWLSHDKAIFDYVEAIAKYVFVIKPKYIHKYLWYKLPVIRNKFLKYVKKDKVDDSYLEEIMTEYGVSEYEARMYTWGKATKSLPNLWEES